MLLRVRQRRHPPPIIQVKFILYSQSIGYRWFWCREDYLLFVLRLLITLTVQCTWFLLKYHVLLLLFLVGPKNVCSHLIVNTLKCVYVCSMCFNFYFSSIFHLNFCYTHYKQLQVFWTTIYKSDIFTKVSIFALRVFHMCLFSFAFHTHFLFIFITFENYTF